MFRGLRRLAASGLALGLWGIPCRPAAAAPADPARRVIVLANAGEPSSVSLARYYAAKRHIPEANIVALPMSAAETITWPEFVATIYQPLQDWLVAHGWIDAFPTTLKDALGRKRYGIFTHHISYLVVCRGVPLRVSHDPAYYHDEPRLALRPELRTNRGAVDSELCLLAHTTYNINGWVHNPLFREDHPFPFADEPVVKVTRLDGPTAQDARRLVDDALAAEKTGLLGRYYVDLRGPHPEGDEWLRLTADELNRLGFDGDINRADGTFPASARFDAPVLYFGWYTPNLNGPMALPGFRFPPGAIALHIHSSSAWTLRSTTAGWCGPLVARGVTATFGNVYEPYLQLTLEPQLLLRALMRGWDLGDAAYYAEPALSWQTIVIGDPLYRPFAVPLAAQLKRIAALPPSLAPYAILRQVRLWEGAGESGKALDLLKQDATRWPGPVLPLALASRLAKSGDRGAAVRALAAVHWPDIVPLAEVPLAEQAAGWLKQWGWAPGAIRLYQAVLRNSELGRDRRTAVLHVALEAAAASGDAAQRRAWERDLAASAAPAASDVKR